MRKKLYNFLMYLIMASLVIGKNYCMFMHVFSDALQFNTVKEILQQYRFLLFSNFQNKNKYSLRGGCFDGHADFTVVILDILLAYGPQHRVYWRSEA